jgi:hypothetical protein
MSREKEPSSGGDNFIANKNEQLSFGNEGEVDARKRERFKKEIEKAFGKPFDQVEYVEILQFIDEVSTHERRLGEEEQRKKRYRELMDLASEVKKITGDKERYRPES